jgi:hypothetical protein
MIELGIGMFLVFKLFAYLLIIGVFGSILKS